MKTAPAAFKFINSLSWKALSESQQEKGKHSYIKIVTIHIIITYKVAPYTSIYVDMLISCEHKRHTVCIHDIVLPEILASVAKRKLLLHRAVQPQTCLFVL